MVDLETSSNTADSGNAEKATHDAGIVGGDNENTEGSNGSADAVQEADGHRIDDVVDEDDDELDDEEDEDDLDDEDEDELEDEDDEDPEVALQRRLRPRGAQDAPPEQESDEIVDAQDTQGDAVESIVDVQETEDVPEEDIDVNEEDAAGEAEEMDQPEDGSNEESKKADPSAAAPRGRFFMHDDRYLSKNERRPRRKLWNSNKEIDNAWSHDKFAELEAMGPPEHDRSNGGRSGRGRGRRNSRNGNYHDERPQDSNNSDTIAPATGHRNDGGHGSQRRQGNDVDHGGNENARGGRSGRGGRGRGGSGRGGSGRGDGSGRGRGGRVANTSHMHHGDSGSGVSSDQGYTTGIAPAHTDSTANAGAQRTSAGEQGDIVTALDNASLHGQQQTTKTSKRYSRRSATPLATPPVGVSDPVGLEQPPLGLPPGVLQQQNLGLPAALTQQQQIDFLQQQLIASQQQQHTGMALSSDLQQMLSADAAGLMGGMPPMQSFNGNMLPPSATEQLHMHNQLQQNQMFSQQFGVPPPQTFPMGVSGMMPPYQQQQQQPTTGIQYYGDAGPLLQENQNYLFGQQQQMPQHLQQMQQQHLQQMQQQQQQHQQQYRQSRAVRIVRPDVDSYGNQS